MERWHVRRLATLGLCLSTLPSFPLSAQVGRDPAQSPYRDITARAGPVAFAGYLTGDRGRAGVGPSGGLTVGMRYEFALGRSWVLQLGANYLQADRFIADPTEPETSPARRIGPVATDILLTEAALQLRLTGAKSWHGFAPFIGAGGGIALDLNSPGDTTDSGYEFGSKFLVTAIAGTRLHLSNRLTIHVDGRATAWRLRYPISFHAAASDGSRVVPLAEPLTDWTIHPWVSLGVGWTF